MKSEGNDRKLLFRRFGHDDSCSPTRQAESRTVVSDEPRFSSWTNESSFQKQSEMLSWRRNEKNEGEKAACFEKTA
jgi:hypothetical protein